MKTVSSKVGLLSNCSSSMQPFSLINTRNKRIPLINVRKQIIPRVCHCHCHLEREGKMKEMVEKMTRGIRTGICAVAGAAVMLKFSALAVAEPLTVAFPASNAREVNTVQRTLVEAWGVVRETFVDSTFNHQDWDLKLQQTMVEMFPLKSADAAYGKISNMLATLGDPFTRLISPKEYQSFRIGSDGNLQGVGLFIGTEPISGRLTVLSSIVGSPAARAGIHAGDELVEIDGESLVGMNGEEAAQKLRGRVGTSVMIKLQNAADYEGGAKIRENAAIDMENAVNALENQDVQSYILDLRNNPGGLVKVGLDVAQIWLDGDETLVNTIDRDGNMLPINMVNGHALTHDPLVILVNEGSASASEILAGALHDNGRAKLVGHKTFGKGKIQSVTELHDGSALFVTVAKYISPALHDIDQVGILPDVQCMPDMLNLQKTSSTFEKPLKIAEEPASSLERDSCILVAEHELDVQAS
ncbi:carboxyl-terminal-processing peptidase 3, chloroplastic isoform X2 [Cryptomeria japonica]|uniref:carboxyl-terminal-processing peptidase 3, chloroplastic isoform X2 n=1 Tax=Cryptomeria japonica TaxID=3369 RepID=UPI0027DA8F45|nr:carboxyl-terminal-processing peptidase 3, chloroplastic isoform X2 [Cryptomeria japonica]